MTDGHAAYLLLGVEEQTAILLLSPDKWDGPTQLHEMLTLKDPKSCYPWSRITKSI